LCIAPARSAPVPGCSRRFYYKAYRSGGDQHYLPDEVYCHRTAITITYLSWRSTFMLTHHWVEEMDGVSHFFNYNIQAHNDGNYQVFDGPEGIGQHGFSQEFNDLQYSGDISAQSTAFPAPPMQPPPLTRSSMPARACIQSEVERYGAFPVVQHRRCLAAIPNLDVAALGSPELTSGSSSATETRAPSHNITPNVTPPVMMGNPIRPSKPPEALFPPPAPLPPRRRRPRKPRPKPELSQEEEEAKREKFLERNRVAAGKCREKRKTWVTDLEDTKLDLENQNSRLRMEHSALLNEVNQTRSILMAHANCSDFRIDKWVENEAKRYVLGAGEQYDSMLANFGLAAGPRSRHDSISSYATATTSEMRTPTHQRSMSFSQSISPAHTGSMPLPQSIPESPILFHSHMPQHDHGERPMMLAGTMYMISPTTQTEDATNPNDYDNMPRTNFAR
jgi:hypothetical protein